MKKLVVYYRVSTRKQQVSGLGLEAQQEAATAYEESVKGKIINQHKERETGRGRAQRRPKLQEAIAECRARRATLVIAKLDRLARNVAFISALMESDVDFVCCDNPTASPLTLHAMAMVAQQEATLISDRTKAALRVKKKQGALLGSARPGHWEGREHLRGFKKANKVSAKVRIIKALEQYRFVWPQLEEMRRQGKTLQEITDWLNDEGFRTRHEKEFRRSGVLRIFDLFKTHGDKLPALAV